MLSLTRLSSELSDVCLQSILNLSPYIAFIDATCRCIMGTVTQMLLSLPLRNDFS